MCKNNYWECGVLNEKVKEKIHKCEKIEELFDYWREIQAGDSEYKEATIDLRKTSEKIYKYISIDSFTPDGIICKEKWDEAEKKVLYIMEEANGYAFSMKRPEKVDYNLNPPKEPIKIDFENGKEEFWFQEVVNGNKSRRKIYPKLNRIQEKITGKENNLSSAAYINLNKRGGFKDLRPSGIWVNFNNYIKRYLDFILKEIEIIKPDYIVGFKMQHIDELLITELRKRGFNRIVNYIYHPSARMSNEKFYGNVEVKYDEHLEELLKQLANDN